MQNRETGLPVFIKVLRIYLKQDNNPPIIIGKIYLAKNFIDKYHAYAVQETESIGALVGINRILYHKPLSIYTYRNQLFIIREFHINYNLN